MANKTTTVTFRMNPSVKEMLRAAADKERRSVANMIEVMILTYAESVTDTESTAVGRNFPKRIRLPRKPRKAP